MNERGVVRSRLAPVIVCSTASTSAGSSPASAVATSAQEGVQVADCGRCGEGLVGVDQAAGGGATTTLAPRYHSRMIVTGTYDLRRHLSLSHPEPISPPRLAP